MKRKIATQAQANYSLKNFLRKNFRKYTQQQLSEKLRLSVHAVRKICYELGLKKLEMEYFTAVQRAYLRRHFQTKGDTELAEIFQTKWPKKKKWTLKHIEKKRKYMGLRRTREQIKAIQQRNKRMGRFAICPVKAWNKRGRVPEGEVRYWKASDGRLFPVVKVNGHFMHWARWAWQNAYGHIPRGSNVVFKDRNPFNRKVSNLLLLTNSELAAFNAKVSSSGLSDNYVVGLMSRKDKDLRKLLKAHPELQQLKRQQLLLNRAIYGKHKD